MTQTDHLDLKTSERMIPNHRKAYLTKCSSMKQAELKKIVLAINHNLFCVKILLIHLHLLDMNTQL